jgi:hypothetical protein
MRATPLYCGLLLLIGLGLLGCEDRGANRPDAASSPAPTLRIPFELYGVPGPWWRNNATQADFDRDMWTCRTESKQARSGATPETRKDVAYRAFLDCMKRLAWSRGYPPSLNAG